MTLTAVHTNAGPAPRHLRHCTSDHSPALSQSQTARPRVTATSRSALMAGVLGLALLSPLMASDAEARELSVSTVLSDAFPWGQAAEKWAELVEERSGGDLTLRVYPNAQLVAGDQTKEFSAMRQGLIDLAVGSTINWSPQVPELNLFSLPFLMPDHAAIDALTQGESGKQVFAAIESKGIKPLAWGENGFREVSNSSKSITSPDDLKGLKIRVVGSPLFQDTFSALGADPTQMSWTDAQPALTTGAVDGQENPFNTVVSSKFYEVQKYLTVTNHVYSPWIVTASKRWWDGLSKTEQDIIMKAAQTARDFEREDTRAEAREALAKIKEQGMEVNKVSPEEIQRMREQAKPAIQTVIDTVGEPLFNEVQAAVEKAPK